MSDCDHKFIDSKVCLKCGVSAAELRAIDAAELQELGGRAPASPFKPGETIDAEPDEPAPKQGPIDVDDTSKLFVAWLLSRLSEAESTGKTCVLSFEHGPDGTRTMRVKLGANELVGASLKGWAGAVQQCAKSARDAMNAGN